MRAPAVRTAQIAALTVRMHNPEKVGNAVRAVHEACQRVSANRSRREMLLQALLLRSLTTSRTALGGANRVLAKHRLLSRPKTLAGTRAAARQFYLFKKWNFLLKVLQFIGSQRKPFWLIRRMQKYPKMSFSLFKVLARLFGYGLLAKRLRAARGRFRPTKQTKDSVRKLWLQRLRHRRRMRSRRYRKYRRLSAEGRRRFLRFRKF